MYNNYSTMTRVADDNSQIDTRQAGWHDEENIHKAAITLVTNEFKLGSTTPILRIFDVPKAKEFYVGFLGFTVDWEHKFEESLPLYMQVSNGGCILHLSEHHGDCCPGAAIRIQTDNVKALHAALLAQSYKFARPGLEKTPWNSLEMQVTDPFGNRIVLCEANE